MPLVFGTGAPTASGHLYADVLGTRYEFPTRYREIVRPGERFVYYTGSRGADGRAVYIGTGVVGDVFIGPNPGRLIAPVYDCLFFAEPLLAKTPAGLYLETGSTKGTNWANGVRKIDDQTMSTIVRAGHSSDTHGEYISESRALNFASPELAHRVERYSVGVVMHELGGEFGDFAVSEMPPGNPGYDVVVTTGRTELHVEVKGTVLPDPVFHLSEGQRRHAELLGGNFRLFVVHRIDLMRSTHLIQMRSGPLKAPLVELNPAAWTGILGSEPLSDE